MGLLVSDMGTTEYQRGLKDMRKQVRVIKSQHGMSNLFAWVYSIHGLGFNKSTSYGEYFILDNSPSKCAPGMIDRPAELVQAIYKINRKELRIAYVPDHIIFDDFEDLRKHILVKELSGLGE